MPVKDASQDWFLLQGESNDFGTMLKMARKLQTCDEKDDLVIQVWKEALTTQLDVYMYLFVVCAHSPPSVSLQTTCTTNRDLITAVVQIRVTLHFVLF